MYSLRKTVFMLQYEKKIMSKLDPGKATRPDSLSVRVLKSCAADLCKPLAKLFQLLFNNKD
jgi:hypothetical protein